MLKQKKPKKKRKRKKPRIWVEWLCGKCHRIHRISFPYSLQFLRNGVVARARWGASKLSSLQIDYGATLTEINQFLNSLFSEKFEAQKYVKISYPQSLVERLKKNEKLAQNTQKILSY